MTIKDIAKESGYAVGTVSKVLNHQPGVSEKAHKAIMEVVKRHNFKLNTNAKYLKQTRNNGIAIIVKGTRNMLFAGLVEILQSQVKDSGHECSIYYVKEEDQEVEQALLICRDRQPLGCFFLGSNQENFRDKFQDVDVPCVMVTNSSSGLSFENLSSVCVDDKEGAKEAVRYLIGLGHTRIGVLGGEMEHSNPAKARYQGCLEVFAEHGLEFDPVNQYACSRFAMDGGYAAMRDLLGRNPNLTAVYAMSDVMAIGAIRAIQDSGLRVPEDISVIGYDGIDLGQYVVPRLTTIKQPGEEIAKRCVEIMLDCIEGEQTGVVEQIPFTLIEGESTRAFTA